MPDDTEIAPPEIPDTPSAGNLVPAPPPLAGDGHAVRRWFSEIEDEPVPVADGTLAGARSAASAYARRAKADNTRRAYRAAVRVWCVWCDHHGLTPLPASGADVAAFLADERGRGVSTETLKLRRAAIRYLHRLAGCPVPTDDACVAETMAGIQRDAASRGEIRRKKVAATATVIRRLLAAIGDTELTDLRDRALILVGFAGALRRSELAGIRIEHLTPSERGLRLTLPQTKGSQAEAVTVALPYGDTELCPVHALERWRVAAGLQRGPLFRRIWSPPSGRKGRERTEPPGPVIGEQALTPQSVALIIQRRAMAAGFGRRDLGGHSLKRGALTTGMERGVHPARLKRLGRHKSYDVLGEYLEFGDLFDGHPLDGVL